MTVQPDSSAISTDAANTGATLHAGRYRLREKLGQGGMGSVYLAEDTLLPGRLVAVKENADTSAAAQSQFKREALLLARLRHPNLPQVMDYFIEANGKQYLVMEYVPGENLMELMRQRHGPLPVTEALSIVEQVMQALAYMHAWRDPESGRVRPVIHRDIKPANIKRTPEGRVVLVDFGIAKVDSGTMTGTAVSAKALTPGYAPLEQYGGGTDARSDIYALGATLYALLTGRAPPSATEMAAGGSKQWAPLLKVLKIAPPNVAKVIERSMQSLVASRYQNIAEMYQALFDRPLSAGIVNLAVHPPNSSKQRSWWAALVVTMFGITLVFGLVWLLAGQQDGNRRLEGGGTLVMLAIVETPMLRTALPPHMPDPLTVAGSKLDTPTTESINTDMPMPTFTAMGGPSATPSASPTLVLTTSATRTATPVATVTAKSVAAQATQALLAEEADVTAQASTLTASWTLLPTATRSPQPTVPLTSTPYPTPTLVPTSTPTPTVTKTHTPTLTSIVDGPLLTVLQDANVRIGPGISYAVIGLAKAGDQFAVVGKNSDSTWWEIAYNRQSGWIAVSLGTATNTDGVTLADEILEMPAIPSTQNLSDKVFALLAAPQHLSPHDGTVFDHYPRTTTLRWNPVPGAYSYTVELDCYHCCKAGQWCTDVGETYYLQPGVRTTTFEFSYVGAQPGRWRVWAVDADSHEGQKSSWWGFDYTQ